MNLQDNLGQVPASSENSKPKLDVVGWRIHVHETVNRLVPPHLVRVWAELESYVGTSPDRACWPSDGTLAAELAISRTHLQRRLQHLEDLGIVERKTEWEKAHH